MKQISLVQDKIDGKPFAVLLINKNSVTAYGAPGQGNTWAEWVNARNTTLSEVDELLDVRLTINKPVSANSINESYVSTFLDQETTDMLMGEVNKKSLLQIVETKSEPEPEYIDDTESDLPDFIPVTQWPLSDVALSAIDVAYKSYLTEYKAKAFHADRQRRALELEVKWARAIWDNDRQGWRCPPNTVNGGQFTNRMGLGCSTGMVRRLGQTLMSIEDRNKLQLSLPGLEDPRGFLYRAGELIDQRAETRIRNFADRKERRAARRVRSMIAKEGKKAKEQAEKESRKLDKRTRRFSRTGDSFRDIYNAYTPDATVAARLRAASTIKLRNIAQGAEQRALQNLNRSQRRKYRAMRDVTEGKLSDRKIQKLRDYGGKIPGSKIGGYLIADPAREDETKDVFDLDGKPHVWRAFSDMDEMHANPWYGREFLTDDKGENIPNPHKNHKWVTVEEVLAMAGLNRATKPQHDWVEMRRGRGFKDSNGQNGMPLIRFAEADEFKKTARANGYHGVRQKLKDDGKGEFADRKPGRKKTKPVQSGPIGDMDWERDELPPSVRKRISAAWTRSRQNLGEWIRNLDPLLEEDEKTRRQRRRSQRSKKTSPSVNKAANILTKMVGANADEEGVQTFLSQGMGATTNYDEGGFSFDLLDRAWTNDPTAEGRRYGWNEVVGQPTREFEVLKTVADRVIAEHDAGVMTQSSDSVDDLNTLIELLRSRANNSPDTRVLGDMSYHNARVVDLFDGEESKKTIVLDTISIAPWMGQLQGGGYTGESGILTMLTSSVQINAPDDVVERAENGQLTLKELVEMAKAADTLQGQFRGSLRSGMAFGYSLDNNWSVVPWNSTRSIQFNRDGAPLTIGTSSFYGGALPEGTITTYIPGARNSRVDLRSGSLISGQMGKETIITPEGADAWENSSIDPWTGLPLDPSAAALLKPGKRTAPGGRRRGKRNVTGATPGRPGIVQRFLSGEGRQLSRERREARRALKGKLPRDTRPIRQRIQAAAIERGRRVTGEARPEWLQAPELDRSVLERESLRQTGQLPETTGLVQRTELPAIYEFPTPNEFPPDGDWINSGYNKSRLDNLNDSLIDLGSSFYPPVKQEDIDMAPELAERVREWTQDLNDPSQPTLPGEESNWGHAGWTQLGDYTYVVDTRDETMPPIAIIHNQTGTTHLIDKNGKHLASLVSRKAANGEDIWVPVGSRETHTSFRGDIAEKPGFIQTLLGKFRRRDAREREQSKPGIAGLRERRRRVSLQNQPNGDPWGIQQYKNHAEGISIDNANIIGPYSFPTQTFTGARLDDFGPYSDKPILNAAEQMADRLSAQLKRQIGLTPQDELTTAAVRDKIEDLRRQGKTREAGIMTNDLHDLAVLDDVLSSSDVSAIDNLKPGRRHALIESHPGFTLSDRAKKQRRPFDPSQIVVPTDASLSQATRSRPRVRTFTSGTPLLDEVSPEASTTPPQRQATGPALIPGVGDVTGTIVFQNGKYFDTTTGLYLEDLSGLDGTSPDIIYQPITMDDVPTDNGIDNFPQSWPLVQIDAGPGMPTKEYAAIAPGVENPDLPRSSARRNAIQRVTSRPRSFTEAFYLLRNRWRALAAGDMHQIGQRWGRSIHNTSELLDTHGTPMLSEVNGLESEVGLSTTFAPVNDVRSQPWNSTIGELVQALRGQSRKSSNPLFAPFLDDTAISETELRLLGTPAARAGFLRHNVSVLGVLDALGVRTNLPFETLYLPSGGNDDTHNPLPGQWNLFDDSSNKTIAIRHLNEALQLDYAASRMREAITNGRQQQWDAMYGTAAGGAYDVTPSRVADIERERDLAWERAARSMVAAIHEAQQARNDALLRFRDNSGAAFSSDINDLWSTTEFVNNGVVAEQLQGLLTKHILTNPRIMDGLTYASIRRMEEDARSTNERMQRLALLRSQAQAAGLRNRATYTPDDIDPITLSPILDPHGDGATQLAPDRPINEILQTLDEHAASGFAVEPLIDPVTGVSVPNQILDEQLEALALMDYAYQKSLGQADPDDYGYTGMPEADTTHGHLDIDALPAEQLEGWGNSHPGFWALLEASGFNGHPMLLSVNEFRELATIEDANGNRQALPIARGTTSPRTRGRAAQMLARLKRAILGRGGEQHGPGEYWTGQPASWDRLSQEATIGLILRGRHRIGSSEILISPDSSSSGNSEEGILASHTYNALWAVANVLGARGFRGGINWSHGSEYRSDLPSVTFDSRTGLYNAAELDALQQAVDTLMAPGDASLGRYGLDSAGKMTVEAYSDRQDFFKMSIIPDYRGITGPRVQDAIEERQRLNAFLSQNLSWLIQLAQLRRDESDPVNGAANKKWNRRLEAAQHELVMMDPNSRAAMAGYDILTRAQQQSVYYQGAADGEKFSRFGDYDNWEGEGSLTTHRPSIVIVLNRSKTPMVRQPILDSGLSGSTFGRANWPSASSPTVWFKSIGLEPNDVVNISNPPGPNATQLELTRWQLILEQARNWGFAI